MNLNLPVVNRKLWYLSTILRIGLGLGILYYVLVSAGGGRAAGRMISTPWLMPGLAMLTIFGAGIEAKRLGILFRAQGMHLSFRRGYRAVAVGTMFNFCIPGGTGGDVVKLYYLASERRGKVVEVATLLIVDRAVALFSLLLLVSVLALVEWENVLANHLIVGMTAMVLLAMCGLAVGGIVACSTWLRASSWYNFLMTRLPMHEYVRRAADAIFVYREHKLALLQAASLSLVGHVALVIMFIAAGRVFIPGAPGGMISLTALLGMLTNALPITPGGLGVGEAALEGLLRSVGYSGGAQLILAWRAGMLALGCIGFVFYITGQRKR